MKSLIQVQALLKCCYVIMPRIGSAIASESACVRRWLFTVNNPKFCVDYYKKFQKFTNVKRFIFGYELALETGTPPHLQGYVQFSVSTRFSAVKLLESTAHWMPANGSSFDNYRYCIKDGKFQLFDSWKSEAERFKREKDRFRTECLSSRTIIRRLYEDSDDDLQYSGSHLSRKKQYDESVATLSQQAAECKLYDKYVGCILRKWQYDLLKKLFQQNDRQVMWAYDLKGGMSKSSLGTFLRVCYKFFHGDGVSSA